MTCLPVCSVCEYVKGNSTLKWNAPCVYSDGCYLYFISLNIWNNVSVEVINMLLYSDSLILWAISIRAGSRNPVSASGDGLDSDTAPVVWTLTLKWFYEACLWFYWGLCQTNTPGGQFIGLNLKLLTIITFYTQNSLTIEVPCGGKWLRTLCQVL